MGNVRMCAAISLAAMALSCVHEASAAEPVIPLARVTNNVDSMKVEWVERKREHELRDRLLRLDRLNPRMQVLANTLWRDDTQNGFSLDVDPGDDKVVLQYRVRF